MNLKMATSGLVKPVISIVVAKTYAEIKKLISEQKKKTLFNTTESGLREHLERELNETISWAALDMYPNHQNNASITNRYVHLDLLLEPRRNHSHERQLRETTTLSEILRTEDENIIILGQPGSGKTTTVKYIINTVLFNSDFLTNLYSYPILIKLRELNKTNSILGENQNGGIFDKLCQLFGIDIDIESDSNDEVEKIHRLKKALTTKVILNIIDTQKILLILDGFDEIVENNTRDLVVAELREISKGLSNVKFILTSRTVDYKIRLERASTFELCELKDQQIEIFSEKWFENRELASSFISELYVKTPRKDFYRRPLLLTHLANIYSKTRELPEKPKLIYETIIDLVLKEWNEIQGIKRKSRYALFTASRKREFLSTVAYYLTVKYSKKIFGKNELQEIYVKINPKFKELPLDEVDEVIEEIESHNGIILRTGIDKFEFSHLTIQEFFVASYLVRSGTVRLSISDLLKIPNEIALAISLSSDPSMLLYDILIDKIFKDDVHFKFLDIFLARIQLEKPDFEIGSVFLICLLTIYTKIAMKDNEAVHSKVRNINLGETYTKLKEVERFILQSTTENIIADIAEYYTIDNANFKTRNNFEYIGLRKLKNAPNEFHNFNFPKYLLWKKEDSL